MERITSRKSPLMAHIRKLNASRDHRRQTGEMVCEGPKMLQEALRWGAGITVVVEAEGATGLPELPSGLRRVSVPRDMLQWISDTKTPQQVLFLVKIPEMEATPQGNRFLVLDGLQDPGNLGTIWRTADAFQADGLFLLNHCADPWGPKTLRATMGACFRFPVFETTLEALESVVKARGIPLFATALREDAVNLCSAELSQAAVVIGSEGRGVSMEVLKVCEKALKIPMEDRCESLNAAVAASVVLWEMYRGAGA